MHVVVDLYPTYLDLERLFSPATVNMQVFNSYLLGLPIVSRRLLRQNNPYSRLDSPRFWRDLVLNLIRLPMQLVENIRQRLQLRITIILPRCRLTGATAFANCSAMDAPSSAASAPDSVWFTARYFCKIHGKSTCSALMCIIHT